MEDLPVRTDTLGVDARRRGVLRRRLSRGHRCARTAPLRERVLTSRVDIAPARWPDDTDAVRNLFGEYVRSLGIDLSFQDVDAELSGLPGRYASPAGALLVARLAGAPVGCVAMRPLSVPGVCEMKRLYVRPGARGHDLGRRLVEALLACARHAGHRRIVLDTLATMDTARRLYASLGFRPVAPYYDNPLPGTAYLALDL